MTERGPRIAFGFAVLAIATLVVALPTRDPERDRRRAPADAARRGLPAAVATPTPEPLDAALAEDARPGDRATPRATGDRATPRATGARAAARRFARAIAAFEAAPGDAAARRALARLMAPGLYAAIVTRPPRPPESPLPTPERVRVTLEPAAGGRVLAGLLIVRTGGEATPLDVALERRGGRWLVVEQYPGA